MFSVTASRHWDDWPAFPSRNLPERDLTAATRLGGACAGNQSSPIARKRRARARTLEGKFRDDRPGLPIPQPDNVLLLR